MAKVSGEVREIKVSQREDRLSTRLSTSGKAEGIETEGGMEERLTNNMEANVGPTSGKKEKRQLASVKITEAFNPRVSSLSCVSLVLVGIETLPRDNGDDDAMDHSPLMMIFSCSSLSLSISLLSDTNQTLLPHRHHHMTLALLPLLPCRLG
mmetsp:Transcript_8553/g.24451  ORF Transcript_8553/g.24451 Transcript_8553/m.24451 type:complete len:152 (-) Transcript_8553:945-1400(-)